MEAKGKVVAVLLVSAFCLTSFASAQDVKALKVQRPPVSGFMGYVPDEIVVKFEEQVMSRFEKALFPQGRTGISELDKLGTRFNVTAIRAMFPGAEPRMYRGRLVNPAAWHRIKFTAKVNVEAVVEAYKALPGVLEAQPIGVHTVLGVPNDPYFSDQWHLDQSNDHDIDGPEAWDIETGNEDIIVSILDTGVRYFHKDLGGPNASYETPTDVDGNMWVNWSEKNGTAGVDDDGNGYVDDWIGWDFVDNAGSFTYPVYPGEDGDDPDNDPRDFNGHGTHCAGNVAAINNNDYATASPAGGWGDGSRQSLGNGVKVMALRIGWSSSIFRTNWEIGLVRMDLAAEAFYYAADNGARIASCSWGSDNSGGIGDAIDYFLASGGLIFKAAGNDGNTSADYMCSRDDIISVAATDANDCKADFSNYGSWVDISAPGDEIWSLYHNHEDPENDYVASISGTSMSTPLAAGVAALIWSQNPSWTASQVEQQLYDSADNIEGESCNSSYAGELGAGRINAFNAVNTGVTPGPDADFSASPTSGCAPLTVSFTDESTGDITSWSWTFGDGGTSSEQNPVHEYAEPGSYTVALTVSGPGGSDTETKPNYIVVSGDPAADFAGSPTSGFAPLTVSFTDQSTGNPTSWSWDFGDGGTSTEQNPTHTYTDPGSYNVSLTVTNACGTDVEEKLGYITVNEPVENLMHVNAVDVVKESWFILTRGKADVQIVDAGGSPVEGATVSGAWSGGATDTDQFTTGSDGWGTAYSNWRWGDAEYTFCVTDVTKTDWTYDESANVETCGSTDGSASSQAVTDVDIAEVENDIGRKLVYNSPNPFNLSTTIYFYVPEASHVELSIYNVSGQKIAILLDRELKAGFGSVVWHGLDAQGRQVGSGYYFYTIKLNGKVKMAQKMLLLK